jgi:Pvc16 N-terminal domain/Carboxypeptidase regulatory-like domain
VIRDLSLTLRAMLTQPGLPAELAAAQIAFDRPGETFTPQQRTLDLFLYDIRENLELRNAEPLLERINGQAVRRPPPMRVDCTYLVTAWPVSGTELPLQEHRLLAQTLQVLSRYRTIPAAFLQDSLKGQEPPLPLVTSQTGGLKEPAEFWSAIGGRLRPSLSVTVTIGLEVFAAETLPLVTTETIRITQRAGGERLPLPETEDRFRIGGRVLAADRKDAAGAAVSLLEAGLSTTADADGRYVIGPVAAGRYTLRAQSGAAVGTVTIIVPRPARSPPGGYDVRLGTTR